MKNKSQSPAKIGMSRPEAVARAIYWAVFSERAVSAIEDMHGWIVYGEHQGHLTDDLPSFVATSMNAITIGSADQSRAYTHMCERRELEKGTFHGMVKRAMKQWAQRHGASVRSLTQMYHAEVARLTKTNQESENHNDVR